MLATDRKESALYHHERLGVELISVLIASSTPHMNNINYKAVNIYQVSTGLFFSVAKCIQNIQNKRTQSTGYDINLMQYVATGCYESWILFLPSFLVQPTTESFALLYTLLQ